MRSLGNGCDSSEAYLETKKAAIIYIPPSTTTTVPVSFGGFVGELQVVQARSIRIIDSVLGKVS